MSNNNSNAIENAEEVIERFGGIRPMAKKINVAVTTVQGWKKRNVIPGTRRDQVIKAAANHNVDLSDILGEAGVANENVKPFSGPIQRAVPKLNKKKQIPQEPIELRHRADAEDLPKTLEQKLVETENRAVKKSIIIAGVLILLTAAIGTFLLWPASDNSARWNTERLGLLENDVDGLKDDVDIVKTEQAFFSTLIPDDLEQRIENLQQQAKETKERVGAVLNRAQEVSDDVIGEDAGTLEQRVEKLEGHLAEVVGKPELASFLDRFNALDQSITGQRQISKTVSELSMLVSSLGGDMDKLGETLAGAREKNEVLGETFEDVPNQDLKAAALLLGMSQFRSSLNRDNKNFEKDLELLVGMVAEDNPELAASLQRLAPHAEEGVLTPGGLSDEFRSLTGDVVIASLKGEDVSFQDKAKARFNQLFQVEKEGELLTGTPTQDSLNKAEGALEEGDVAGAIAAIQTLEGPAAEAAQPWLDQANATLLSEQVKALLSQNITLKAHGAAGLITGQPLGGSELIQNEETGINILKR